MSEKPYDLGIAVGRFQCLHKGHEDMLNSALSICKEVGVFIGSAGESGTAKNPFSFEIRKEMLYNLYGNKISVFPLYDIGVGNNTEWGNYVLKNISERFGRYPDVLFSGEESRRTKWFSEGKIKEIFIPKTVKISASLMRDYLIDDRFDEWKKYTNEKLYRKYEFLREIALKSKGNTETSSL